MSDAKSPKVELEVGKETGAVTVTAHGRRVVIHANGRLEVSADVVPALAVPQPSLQDFVRELEKTNPDLVKRDFDKARDLGRRWPGAGSVSGRDLPSPDVYWRESPTILPYLPTAIRSQQLVEKLKAINPEMVVPAIRGEATIRPELQQLASKAELIYPEVKRRIGDQRPELDDSPRVQGAGAIRGEVADWVPDFGGKWTVHHPVSDAPRPNCGPSPDMLGVVERPAVWSMPW